MRKPGIYKIQSKLFPDRIYIGSAVNFKSRWQLHLSDLIKNKHHSGKLQNHVNKYGIDDLIFTLIEPCFPDWLIIREQYYMDKFNPYFNVCKKAGSCLGRKISEDHKRRLSEQRKGKKGNPCSEEQKLKISMANKGKKRSIEVKEKLRKYHTGRKWSEESKLKASKSHAGIKRPSYIGKKIGEANRRRKYSDRAKRNMSIAHQRVLHTKNPNYGIQYYRGKFRIYLWRMGKSYYGGNAASLNEALLLRSNLESKINLIT